jgi:hypothetical protein
MSRPGALAASGGLGMEEKGASSSGAAMLKALTIWDEKYGK